MRARAPRNADLPLLQKRLTLNNFFCRLLGYEDFKGLRERLVGTRAGVSDGHTFFFETLRSREGLRISEDRLGEYDLRICEYAERLNTARAPRVELLYFQYLAVLFAEIFLDRYFNERNKLLGELNAFVRERNFALPAGSRRFSEFKEEDLSKLAFWMATGSGKTLIMHVNLWQYLHYSEGKARHDNILLITPNEGLSRQHLEELRKSGISARHYGESEAMAFGSTRMPVTVIEITKLTESKRGGGLSVDVEAFGPDNLLLVDEGHRGASGDVWRDLRSRVAERGFTFEYSATFGQIVNGAGREKRPALLEEYSKAILFDYSYPHFYEDGYGKDYWIVNLSDETDAFNYWMLLGNTLSFYEQSLLYRERREEFRRYDLEKPLWVFAGHSVTGGKSAHTKDDRDSLTDVEEVVAFFDKFLKNKEVWTERIGRAIAGDTGVRNESGEDIFQGRFPYLRKSGANARQLYDRIVEVVFNARPGETIRALELKQATGEIGLQVGSENAYFGVINIGDAPGLKKLLDDGGIPVGEENISGSLFSALGSPDSPVNVLIGSRKFMEGWDSFRVSSMGLMNIGKGEGSQIIQLFGRGVRLHGKDNTLKRSKELDPAGAPQSIELLETLNVFGIRANYMAQFRNYLKQEGIDTDSEELYLPIVPQKEFLRRGLQVLRLPDGVEFPGVVVDGLRENLSVTLDLRPKLEVAGSASGEVMERAGGEDQAAYVKQRAPLLDWQRIHFELLSWKRASELHNLSFTPGGLRRIVESGEYTILCTEEQLGAKGFRDLRRVERAAASVLRKYLAACYDRERKAWERTRLTLQPLEETDENLRLDRYVVRAHRKFIEDLRKMAKQVEQLREQDEREYPFIHFDRHLYHPLLVAPSDSRVRIESSAPPALNPGEAQFVRDLRKHLQDNAGVFDGREVFLLRNLSRGKGVGFFDAKDGEAFYPDFILWVVQAGRQRIVFLDPHGIQRTKGLEDPKVRLHRELRDLKSADPDISVTSYIIAPGSYNKAARESWVGAHDRERLEQEHVLFQEDAEYIKKLFGGMAMTYYFAYGLNMSRNEMENRIGIPATGRCWAVLDGYRREFNKKTSTGLPGEGKANIMEDSSSRVEGVLYDVTDADLHKLDSFEGGYDRRTVTVTLDDGQQVQAETYKAHKETAGLKPTEQYMSTLLKAQDVLSEECIRELEAVDTLD